MKKILFFLALFFCGVSPAFAQTADAKAFAQKIADDIMANVVLKKSPLPEKEKAFRRIFTEAADVGKVARFTLGRFAKTAPEKELNAFTTAFINSVIETWTRRFNDYAGEKIVFKDARQEPQKDVYVHSVLDIPNSDNDIEIIWRISAKNNEFKLVDLVVEGVSMILSYRNEYAAILQQNNGNIPDLIARLNAKTIPAPQQ